MRKNRKKNNNGFDTSVFVITNDGQNIITDEYDMCLDGDGVFVMLTNDELNQEFGNDNSICLYRDWIDAVRKMRNDLAGRITFVDKEGYVACVWQDGDVKIPGTFKLNETTDKIGDLFDRPKIESCMRKYLDGFKLNTEIIRIMTRLKGDKSIEQTIPAIMASYHAKVDFNGRILHGYLPAIGQLLFIYKNITAIDDALVKTRGQCHLFPDVDGNHQDNYMLDQTLSFLKNYWWSVTETNDDYIWCMKAGFMDFSHKCFANPFLPIFAI